MKKLIAFVIVLLFAGGLCFAVQTDTTHHSNVSITTTPDTESPDVTLSGGSAYISGTLEVDGACRFDGPITSSSSENSIQRIWIDPLNAVPTGYRNVSTVKTALIDKTSTYQLSTGDYTDCVYPRNALVRFRWLSGSTTGQISGTVVVNGVDHKGNVTSETFTMTYGSNTTTGNVAWRTITSYDVAITTNAQFVSDTNVYVQFGYGNKFGLLSNLADSSEIMTILENGALSTTYTVDYTYDTIDFATDPPRPVEQAISIVNHYIAIIKPLLR